MASYLLNQFLDLEEIVMCKQLLSLDLRDSSQTSALPLRPVGYQRSCSLSVSSSALSLSDSTESAAMNSSGNWGGQQQAGGEASLPSRWTPARDHDTGSLGWASTPNGRYKTEMCRTFAKSGICIFGRDCQFAHGTDEIRDFNRHPKYKTKPCLPFHTIGFCPYGIHCHFVHNNNVHNPLLKQSFSFAGLPSAPPPPPHPLGHPSHSSLQHQQFLRVPSVSPPAMATSDFADLLGGGSHPFLTEAVDSSSSPRGQFLPSPDSGYSLCGMSPVPSPFGRRLPIFSQLSVPDKGLGAR